MPRGTQDSGGSMRDNTSLRDGLSGLSRKKDEPPPQQQQPVAGWVPLKQLSDSELEKEVNTTLAAMLPFRAPPLNPTRVLVDTTAGLREGHGAQEHVVRDFDSRFKKTSTGNPLFTTGVFIKPPSLPLEPDGRSRAERRAALKEEEFRQRGLTQTAEEASAAAADDGASSSSASGEPDTHLAMELAQHTWNNFELSRKNKSDKGVGDSIALKGVDPSRIQQLLAHNIRSAAPERIQEPDCARHRSSLAEAKKQPHPVDEPPLGMLPSSPLIHYFEVPEYIEAPPAHFSLLAERLTDGNYVPQPFIETAKGNEGDLETEAPLVLNPSPPEAYLHVPGKEQSYFSVPATPPTMSLAAPRDAPQEQMPKAAVKEAERRPRPLAPSTPPEATFFVPHREIPALPSTGNPKSAGFGSFVATPVQEKLEQKTVGRHKGADPGAPAPTMLLPRTPAEVTIDAPAGSKLAEHIGTDKSARRPDMFSIPPSPPAAVVPQDRPEKHNEVQLGSRPRPVLPRTPAETKLQLPRRDPTGAQLPPSGEFFSIPATPPSSVTEQLPAPVIIRSRRKQDESERADTAEFIKKATDKALAAVEEEDQKAKTEFLAGERSEWREMTDEAKHLEVSLRVNEALALRRRTAKYDPSADDVPKQPLPATPAEDYVTIPGFTTNQLAGAVEKMVEVEEEVDAAAAGESSCASAALGATPGGTPIPRTATTTDSSPGSRSITVKRSVKKKVVDIDVLTVFGAPATPVDKPVQPAEFELHPVNPEAKPPKPMLPPTPLEPSLTLPVKGNSAGARAGQQFNATEDCTFSLPPTPPAAPLFGIPPVGKKEPNVSEPDGSKMLLPPSPVDPRMEPLPPAKGIDMHADSPTLKHFEQLRLSSSRSSSTAANRGAGGAAATAAADDFERSVMFSVPATPPDQDLPKADVFEPKSEAKQEREQQEAKTNQQQGVQMRDGVVAKALMPPTPPEMSHQLPPGMMMFQKAVVTTTTPTSRSGSAASSLATAASSVAGRPPLAPGGGAAHGQFFSVPSTPPVNPISPTLTIKRKQHRQQEGVVDTKPIIPSTPPDDFFDIPRGSSRPGSDGGGGGGGGPGSGGSGPGGGGGGGGSSQQRYRQFTVHGDEFFSVGATPPGATAPLPPRGGGATDASYGGDSDADGDRPRPAHQDPNRPAKPHMPTPQELSFGVPNIPPSAPKPGYVEKPRPDYDEYYSRPADPREPVAPSQQQRLEDEMKRLEAETEQLRAQEARGEKLTPEQAARKIQCLQRQRMARKELERLKTQRAERDKAEAEEAERKQALEHELQLLDAQSRQLDAKAKAEGRALTPDEAALKIQSAQRQRRAKRELERLRNTQRERQRTDAERETALQASDLEQQLRDLERQQKSLDDAARREGRQLTESEAALKIQCLQRQRMARKQLGRLKGDKADRQRAEAEAVSARAAAVSQQIEKLQAELQSIDQQLAALDSNSSSLTPEQQQQTLAQLVESRAATVAEIERLRRDEETLEAEAHAIEAAAKHSDLSEQMTKKRDDIKVLDQRIAEMRQRARTDNNRPLSDAEHRVIEQAEAEKQERRAELAELERRAKVARSDAEAQIAEAEASKAQDDVERLEAESKRLEAEAAALRDKEAQQGALGPEDAARKIQCLQRQRIAKRELEKRRKEAAAREESKQRLESIAQLQNELAMLQQQEQLFAATAAERGGDDKLSEQEQQLRSDNRTRTRRVEHDLERLRALGVMVDVNASIPALGLELLPSPQGSPRTARGSSPTAASPGGGAHDDAAAGASMTPRPSADRSGGAISGSEPAPGPRLPPSPAENNMHLPTGDNSNMSAEPKTHAINITDSLPADTPAVQPHRPSAERHPGADDSGAAVRPVVIPHTPEVGTGMVPPRQGAHHPQPVTEADEQRDFANKMKEIQAEDNSKEERHARQQEEEAAAAAAEVQKAEDAAKSIDAELEQLRAKEARGEKLSEDEATKKQQRLEEQQQAERELEQKRVEAHAEQQEAEAARAAQAAAAAEETLRAEQEELRAIEAEAEAEGRALTDKEAEQKAQTEAAQRELEQKQAAAHTEQQEAEAARAAQAAAAAEETLRAEQEELRAIEAEAEAEGRALTDKEAEQKAQTEAAQRELEQKQAAAHTEQQEAEAARAAQAAAAAEETLRAEQEELRAIEAEAEAEGRALTDKEAEQKAQTEAAQRELEQKQAAAHTEQQEAEAARAAQEQQEAEEQLRAAEEEMKQLAERAKAEGRALTDDEAARRIQCLQRQRLAKKEVARRKAKSRQEQQEAEAAKAAQEQQEAEAKLRAADEEMKALEAKAAAGGALSEDDAARRLQCMQRQRLAKKELARRKATAAKEQADVEEAKAEAELAELRRRQEEIEASAKAEGRGLSEEEAALKIQCLQRQRLAKQQVERRKAEAEAREAELAAVKAAQEQQEAEERMRAAELEAQEIAARAKAEGRALTEEEAARRIQCLQRQRMARAELTRRKRAAETAAREAHEAALCAQQERLEAEEERRRLEEAERARARALVHERPAVDILNVRNVPLTPETARIEANRHAASAVRDAQSAAERHYARSDMSNHEDGGNVASNLMATASPPPPLSQIHMSRADSAASSSVAGPRSSLPGLDNNQQQLRGAHAHSPSVASSHLHTPDGRGSNLAVPPHGQQQQQPQRSAFPGPSPIIIRRFSGSGSSTPTQPPLTAAAATASPKTSVIYRPGANSTVPGTATIVKSPTATGDPADRPRPKTTTTTSVVSGASASPAPRALESHVASSPSPAASPIPATSAVASPQQQQQQHSGQQHSTSTTVAASMKPVFTMVEFAQQLETYFSTFDPQQMDAIKSLAPAYRNKQRELWEFLEHRYEKKAESNDQRSGGAAATSLFSPAGQSAVSGTTTTTTTTTTPSRSSFVASPQVPSPTPIIIRRNSQQQQQQGQQVASPVQDLVTSDGGRQPNLVEDLALSEIVKMLGRQPSAAPSKASASPAPVPPPRR